MCYETGSDLNDVICVGSNVQIVPSEGRSEEYRVQLTYNVGIKQEIEMSEVCYRVEIFLVAIHLKSSSSPSLRLIFCLCTTYKHHRSMLLISEDGRPHDKFIP
jgi:hypothetical protein